MSRDYSCRGHLRGGGPHLIHLGAPKNGSIPNAPWMVANQAKVRAAPFDGIMFQFVGSSYIMSNTVVSRASIAADLAGFSTANFAQCTHNWPVLYIENGYTPNLDYTNNVLWATITQNWANLAAECAAAGNIAGIMLDTENYSVDPDPWDYRPDLNPAPWNTGTPIFNSSVPWATARDQVHARGKQVMDAVIAQWPTARVMLLKGSFVSFPETGAALAPMNWDDISFVMELAAAFCGGMAESTAANNYQAVIVEGGEIYQLTTTEEVYRFKLWCHRMARLNPGAVLKPSAASTYLTNNSIGMFDLAFDGWTAAELEELIGNVMRGVDTYAWLYTESLDPVEVSGTLSAPFRTAITNGRLIGKGGALQAGSSGGSGPTAYTHTGSDNVALTTALIDSFNGGSTGTSDSFTGTNGAAWASPWATSVGSAGGVVDIQGNRGRMVTPTSVGDGARAFYGTMANGEFTIKISFPNPATTFEYINLVCRASGWQGSGDYPADGYMASFQPGMNNPSGEFWMFEFAGGSIADYIASGIGFVVSNGVDTWVKVRFVGTSFQIRAWNVGTSEPATWNILDDPTALTARSTGLWGVGVSALSSNVTVYFDDLSWTQV